MPVKAVRQNISLNRICSRNPSCQEAAGVSGGSSVYGSIITIILPSTLYQ